MNIEGALLAEQEYLDYRSRGEEPYSLLSKVQEYGFQTLDEYFKQKIIHQVKQLDFSVKNCPPQTGANETILLTLNKEPGFIVVYSHQTFIFHGDEELNTDYCEENNIEVINYNTHGGNIVVTDGDLSIGISVPVPGVDSAWVLDRIAEKMNRYTTGVTVDGNDILYNGYKVAGSATYYLDESFGFVIQFSFSDKTELINAICKPETMGKPITHIDFMTRDELCEEILEWRR